MPSWHWKRILNWLPSGRLLRVFSFSLQCPFSLPVVALAMKLQLASCCIRRWPLERQWCWLRLRAPFTCEGRAGLGHEYSGAPVAPGYVKQPLSSAFHGQGSTLTFLLVFLSLCPSEWEFCRTGFPLRTYFGVPRLFPDAPHSPHSTIWLGQSCPRSNNPGRQTG